MPGLGAGSELRTFVPAALLAGPRPHREAFAKTKGILRKTEAHTREALVEAPGAAVPAVTARDARVFFGHRCYRVVRQSC